MTTATQAQEVQLGIHDLKELFPELTHYGLDTLAPLFDRLLTRFIDFVQRLGNQEHSMRFFCGSFHTISDVVSHPKDISSWHLFVVNGKIVELSCGDIDLPMRKNQDDYPNGYYSIRIKSSHPDASKWLFEMIKGFMVRQNLYVLRAEINAEIPDVPQAFPGGQEQEDFYRNVGTEQWVPNMAGGLTPELVLMTMFEYCDAFFPRDWQPLLEEIFAAQQEHRFLSLLGLHRGKDGRIVSDIFDAAIRYLLDNEFIWVRYMQPKSVRPEYGKTRLRIQGNHKTSEQAELLKRHHDLIWSPCYNLGRRLNEKFGSPSLFLNKTLSS